MASYAQQQAKVHAQRAHIRTCLTTAQGTGCQGKLPGLEGLMGVHAYAVREGEAELTQHAAATAHLTQNTARLRSSSYSISLLW